MSRFEALLRKYGEQTECDPPGSIEAKVLSRVHPGARVTIQTCLARPAVRAAAMAASLAMGFLTVAAPPVAATAGEPLPELAVFAPDAPHLPSTWLGRIK